MKQILWLRAMQFILSSLVGSGLSLAGFVLLRDGVQGKGTISIQSSVLSGSVTAEAAGLAMIFVALVVFALPFFFRSEITRDRIISGWCPAVPSNHSSM